MEDINLSITLDEVNLILTALGQMPYIKVSNLINRIQAQAKAQIEESKSNQTVSSHAVQNLQDVG